jgi:hypothetical protein
MKLRRHDVRIGSKEEKAWSDIQTRAQSQLEELFREIKINERIVELAKEQVEFYRLK